MTTIVANREEMACDTQVDDDGVKSYVKTKIERMPNGDIVGTAGSYSEGLKFMEWYRKGCPEEKPELDDSWGALVLRADGVLVQYDSGMFPIELDDDWYAVGSGAMAAMAAMCCEKTPTQAARVACLVDTHSGGRVKTLKRSKANGSKATDRRTVPTRPRGVGSERKKRGASRANDGDREVDVQSPAKGGTVKKAKR